MERKPFVVYLGRPGDHEAQTDVMLTDDEADVVRFVAELLDDPAVCRPGLHIEAGRGIASGGG